MAGCKAPKCKRHAEFPPRTGTYAGIGREAMRTARRPPYEVSPEETRLIDLSGEVRGVLGLMPEPLGDLLGFGGADAGVLVLGEGMAVAFELEEGARAAAARAQVGLEVKGIGVVRQAVAEPGEVGVGLVGLVPGLEVAAEVARAQ